MIKMVFKLSIWFPIGRLAHSFKITFQAGLYSEISNDYQEDQTGWFLQLYLWYTFCNNTHLLDIGIHKE